MGDGFTKGSLRIFHGNTLEKDLTLICLLFIKFV